MDFTFAIENKKDHIDFFRRGNLYMDSLENFLSLEKILVESSENAGTTRYEIYEGFQNLVVPDENGEAILKNSEYDSLWVAPGVQRPVVFTSGFHKQLNTLAKIFCMYKLSNIPYRNSAKLQVDRRLRNFGKYFAIVTDVGEFNMRIKRSLDKHIDTKTISEYMCDSVVYFDKAQFSGEKGPYMKDGILSWQNEYRICILNSVKAPYTLVVEDLSDITRQGYTDELIDVHINADGTLALKTYLTLD